MVRYLYVLNCIANLTEPRDWLVEIEAFNISFVPFLFQKHHINKNVST